MKNHSSIYHYIKYPYPTLPWFWKQAEFLFCIIFFFTWLCIIKKTCRIIYIYIYIYIFENKKSQTYNYIQFEKG